MADISKIKPNGASGEEYEIKDTTARTGVLHLNALTQSTKTVTGNPITVNDAAPINAEDITVDITPVQDLHGYDHPWVGGAGDNIFTSISWEQGAISSIQRHTYEQNKVELTTRIRITALFPLTNGETYTINFNNATYEAVIQAYDSNGISIDAPTHYNEWLTNYQEFSGVAYIGVAVRKKDGTNISISDASDANVRINRGGYSNICPIEGWTSAKLDRVGKNWFDKSAKNTDRGYVDNYLLYSDGREASNGNFYISEYIRIKPNTTMVINALSGAGPSLCFYDSNKTYISGLYYNNRTSMSFTTPNTALYLRISVYKTLEGEMQLELGTQPTTYEPYQGQQYTQSFGEAVHGGKWHVTEGGTDKTMAIVDFGDLSWRKDTSGAFYARLLTKKGGSLDVKASCYATLPTSFSFADYSTYPDGIIAGDTSSTSQYLYVKDTAYTDADTFKAARTGQTIVYELATPTTISTPKQNVPMLKGINTVSADCGDTSLKYQPDNVIGELKGEIRAVEAELAEVEENLEIFYEDHVANTSMGIIVDGYSVGDMPFSNALDIAKTGYIPIAVTDTSIVHSTVANQGEIATHCLLDVTNNRVRFYVHVMDSAASLTIPPNSLTFRVAYKKA